MTGDVSSPVNLLHCIVCLFKILNCRHALYFLKYVLLCVDHMGKVLQRGNFFSTFDVESVQSSLCVLFASTANLLR